jgi:hypothetical protein
MEPDFFGKTAPGRRASAEFWPKRCRPGRIRHRQRSGPGQRRCYGHRFRAAGGQADFRASDVWEINGLGLAQQAHELGGGTPPCLANHAGLFPFARTVRGTLLPDKSAAALLTRLTGHRHQQDPGRRRDVLTHTPPRMSCLDSLAFAVRRNLQAAAPAA